MAITVAMRTQVSQLYVSLFGRAPDTEGMGFWVTALGNGTSVAQIAESMYNTAPARAYYPAFATNQEIVATFYQNVLGRPADAEGLAFWTKELAAAPSKGAFFTKLLNNVVNYTGTDPDGLASQALFVNKVTVAQYYAEKNGDIAGSTVVLNGVTSNVSTVAAAKAQIDGIEGGETIVLTPEQDKIDIATAVGVDTIRSILSDGYGPNSSQSTFTLGDEIKGNDKTVVEIMVAGGYQVQSPTAVIYAPYVSMSGIDKLEIINALDFVETGELNMNAGDYGTDISSVTLDGRDGLTVDIDELTVEGSLNLAVAAGTDGGLHVHDSEIDGLTFGAEAYNSDSDKVGFEADVSVAGVDVVLGEDDTVAMHFGQDKTAEGGATVGSLTLGDINIAMGVNADFGTLSFSSNLNGGFFNYANSTGKGNATAGNLTVGNIDVVAAEDAEFTVGVSNSAIADTGSATVGNVKVGNISISADESDTSGAGQVYVWNYAETYKGAATAGNLEVGDVTMTVAATSCSALNLSIYNGASAEISGNAKVGNITIGNIDVIFADNMTSSASISVMNYATAAKGDASVGNISVGDINIAGGNETGDITAMIINSATVSIDGDENIGTGNAKVGNINVGNIDMVAGSNASLTVSISNNAETEKGTATVGNISIGDVNGSIGLEGYLNLNISALASGAAGSNIGNITVGNLDFYGEPDASIEFSLSADASTGGNVGNVTLGDAVMAIDGGTSDSEFNIQSTISYWVDLQAKTDVGDVKIGDLTMTLGSHAQLEYFTVDVSAADDDISSFTVGDITINAGISSSDGNTNDVYQDWDIHAGHDIGDITVGNVTINAAKDAVIDEFDMYFSTDTGSIGDVDFGDTKITVAAGKGAVSQSVYFTADDGMGDVNVGDVTLSAGKGATAYVYHSFDASYDIGTMTYGDLSLTAKGTLADASYELYAFADGDAIGAVTIGDIGLTVSGSDADAIVGIYFDGSDGDGTYDSVGDMIIGNVTMNISNDSDAETEADAELIVETNGNVTLGNLTVTAGAVIAKHGGDADVDAHVNVTADGNIKLGNITVVGGQSNDGKDQIDNLYILSWQPEEKGGPIDSWLQLTAGTGKSVTVGNIDYSGYQSLSNRDDVVINVSKFKGAANIVAAQGKTEIYDNSSKNVITLGAGNDIVYMDATKSTTDKTSESAIDEIIKFVSGKDVLKINGTDDKGDDFAFVSSDAGTYANFLTSAASAMSNNGTDIYARVLNGNVYVAVDKDGGSGSVDFVVKLTGITTLDEADVIIN